jgi:sugar phosphate permease
VSSVLTAEQRSWRWRVIIATFFGYAGYYFCRKAFGLVKTSIEDEFTWPMDAIAYLWAAYLFAYMIGQFLSGYIGRKWGPRVLLLGGLALSIACNIVFGTASSYWVFMTFMVFNGIVQASGWPGSVGSIAQWVRPSERGLIMGGWGTSYVGQYRSQGRWLLHAGNRHPDASQLAGILLCLCAYHGCYLVGSLFLATQQTRGRRFASHRGR